MLLVLSSTHLPLITRGLGDQLCKSQAGQVITASLAAQLLLGKHQTVLRSESGEANDDDMTKLCVWT